MLNALREGAGSIVAKIFIGVLAASFAVWGISDVYTGGNTGALATVGGQKITEQQYQSAFQRRLRATARQFGRQLTIDQARQRGLDQQVLQQLIADAALDNQAGRLKLAISNKAIANAIVKNPLFLNASGNFDKALFQQILVSNSLTEDIYVAIQRQNNLRGQLSSLVSSDLSLPDFLMKLVHRQINETRKAEYFILPPNAVAAAPEPSDSEIKSFYDANKTRFTAPEFRQVTLLILEAKDLAKKIIKVSDGDVRKAYTDNIANFTKPETRTIEQISFKTLGDAANAKTKLDGGMDFMALAKSRGLKPKDILLGDLAHSAIPDAKLAKAAFGLKLNEISQPIEGALSNTLIRITKITQEVKQTFDKVKDKLRQQIAMERAKEQVINLHDAVEDERAGGASFKEIASKLNLSMISIAAIDAKSLGPDSKPIKGLPRAVKLLSSIFQSDVGVEADPVDTLSEGFVWFEVTKTTKSALKPLNKVRPQVIAAWKKDKKRQILGAKAGELVRTVSLGATLLSQAESLSQKVVATKMLKRTGIDGAFTRTAVNSLFLTTKYGVAQAAGRGGAIIIFRVVDITVPYFSPSSKTAKALKKQMATSISRDLMLQYIDGIKTNVGTNINQVVWRRLRGLSAQ